MAKGRRSTMRASVAARRSSTLDVNRSFYDSSKGRWAGERLFAALKANGTISPAVLRTLDTLRKDEWIAFDAALVEEGKIRLTAVADLMSSGLVKTVPNGMGKTLLQYEKVSDMEPAEVSMDGMARSDNDRLEFALAAVPLPITHKDFNINLRTLMASRTTGEPLDTLQVRTAGRLVSEKIEDMLFNGGPTFAGNPIYGLLTHPDRNEIDFATAGEGWADAGKTGEEILLDVNAMIATANADRYYGPFMLYIPSAYNLKLNEDFKAASDKSVRSRILEITEIRDIRVSDKMAADQAVLVQMTEDVVVLVEGEPLQTIQWDINGGMQVNFKAFTIQVPLVRSDNDGRSGVVHLHQL